MALWKKKIKDWPPDDPPKSNGTTLKGIETFGDREKKAYNDSLNLYKTNPNPKYGFNKPNYNPILTKDGVPVSFIDEYWDNDKIKPIAITIGDGKAIYKKPTGNSLVRPIAKVPTINPNIPTELPKLPIRPLPQGNVEVQNTGYTNIGMRKKPDGTRFIYDKSGKTDKTIDISDNRIGFEEYIKKLYE
jgi:hypothetical protein